jgi:hypothetical protein
LFFCFLSLFFHRRGLARPSRTTQKGRETILITPPPTNDQKGNRQDEKDALIDIEEKSLKSDEVELVGCTRCSSPCWRHVFALLFSLLFPRALFVVGRAFLSFFYFFLCTHESMNATELTFCVGASFLSLFCSFWAN